MDKINKEIEELLEKAFQEDFGDSCDVTSEAIFKGEKGSFELVSKDEGILCGLLCFTRVFQKLDKTCSVGTFFIDGDVIKKGDIIAEISGNIALILKAERTALNLLSHLSGIASKTALFVTVASGKLKILDTRKTIPGMRELQKYAVRCGGGFNHRMGLYDMVMIKDNHTDSAGGITLAVGRIRKKWGKTYKIVVETRNLEEVKEALSCQVDRIMLDNMDIPTMKKAVKLIQGKAEIEASGNMNLERIAKVASIGVDFISVGELTHSVKAFDFSLRGKR
ncbi:MAG: carboxylating nicotinate-nucleotide diphosphorylase [Candidatus Cloacimonetes bacterium]|nr:carboxylating nicotinate-nucleotide diphosphorylase [Candidatus Cloacimonadota bacterium]